MQNRRERRGIKEGATSQTWGRSQYPLHSPSSCEQLRQIIRDEEGVKSKIRLEHEDKRRRETNIMVYGLTERDKEEEINEFSRVTEELEIQAKVLDTVRIGKVMDQDKPRPLRIKLESKYWRQKIISNAHKLKFIPRFSRVYIRPDLTPMKESYAATYMCS